MQKLTEKEKEILKFLCLPSQEIAKRLIVEESTIRTHITNLFNKFNLLYNNRQCLLIEAIKQQVIKLDELITE